MILRAKVMWWVVQTRFWITPFCTEVDATPIDVSTAS